MEVRRSTYEVIVDGKSTASVGMNDIIEVSVPPGSHTVRVQSGRNSSRTTSFQAAEGEIVTFRCTGKSFLPIFLVSFFVRSRALSLVRE